MSNNKNKNLDKKIELPVFASNSKRETKNYWRSLTELFNSNDKSVLKAKHDEFVEGVTAEFDIASMNEPSRRKFLALMGLSGAFVATACTDYRDKGEIIAYNKKPESIFPGVANYYASSIPGRNKGYGILIKTREGRPIKVDGNPEHPINKGKIDSQTQAEIINLYDPNRLQNPKLKSEDSLKLSDYVSDWKKVDAKVVADLKNAASSGKEIAILTRGFSSLTEKALFDTFITKYPTTKIYNYETSSDENRVEGWRRSFGNEYLPDFNFANSKVILALESDFMGTESNASLNIASFAKSRNVEDLDNFSRFYAIEAMASLTGTNADYRLRLTPENQYDFVLTLIAAVSAKGVAIDASVLSKVSGKSIANFAKQNGYSENETKALNQLVEDLVSNKGRGTIVVGTSLPADVHVVANYLNYVLGNNSNYSKDSVNHYIGSLSSNQDLKNLVGNMNAGKVGVLINFDVNPAYELTDDLGFDSAIAKVKTKVTFCESENETTELSNVILPINHIFESWGDVKTKVGVISLQQPVIEPLYNTRQKEAVLLNWTNDNPENFASDLYHKFIQAYWEANVYTNVNPSVSFKEFWFACLHDGYVQLNEVVPENIFNTQAVLDSKNNSPKSSMTLILHPSYAVGDGKYANNGYLQEMPHPLSKVAWDNYAALAPKTAMELKLEYKDLVTVSVNGKSIDLPVMLQPGQAENTIIVELGYGRTVAGPVGTGVGFDASSLMTSNGGISKYIYTGATVTPKGGKYELVTTQEHHVLDDTLTSKEGILNDFHKQRQIIQEANLNNYKNNPEILKEHKHNIISLTKDHTYTELKWAMALDLNKCVGCNQCSIACFVENNIPVVGKDQVKVGREMSWIRIDRYYSGHYDSPEVHNQPMLCMHCDNAPCENVCPVVATTHSPDGLNQMVYNRCVGTRYCANNCPYKVRRFNFFDFRDHVANGFYKSESMELAMNPEVSVRARGVMEKCTFCTQRIMEARQEAKEQGRTIKGEDVKTACQEACPADAIIFGDANDSNSAVSKLREHNLGYNVLDYLNVKPNVTYVARLRNTIASNENKEVNNGGH